MATNGAAFAWYLWTCSETIRNQMLQFHLTNIIWHSAHKIIIIDIKFLCCILIKSIWKTKLLSFSKVNRDLKKMTIFTWLMFTYWVFSFFQLQLVYLQLSYWRTDQDFLLDRKKTNMWVNAVDNKKGTTTTITTP